jgi:hypothetical protein
MPEYFPTYLRPHLPLERGRRMELPKVGQTPGSSLGSTSAEGIGWIRYSCQCTPGSPFQSCPRSPIRHLLPTPPFYGMRARREIDEAEPSNLGATGLLGLPIGTGSIPVGGVLIPAEGHDSGPLIRTPVVGDIGPLQRCRW